MLLISVIFFADLSVVVAIFLDLNYCSLKFEDSHSNHLYHSCPDLIIKKNILDILRSTGVEFKMLK